MNLTLINVINLLLEMKQHSVFAHIDGPQGVGKTSLIPNLKKLGFVVTDLDVFDEMASKKLKLPSGWKSSDNYSDSALKKLHKTRQQLLNEFINKHKKEKIILVGIHIEGDTAYSFNTKHRFLFIDKIKDILLRRAKRDKLSKQEILNAKKETNEMIDDLLALHYTKMTKQQLLDFFTNEAS